MLEPIDEVPKERAFTAGCFSGVFSAGAFSVDFGAGDSVFAPPHPTAIIDSRNSNTITRMTTFDLLRDTEEFL
jgi:hypothetical protein